MSLTILIPKDFTVMDRLKSFLAPGKSYGATAAGYIDDLAALGKTIVLCAGCYRGGWFNWKRAGYYPIYQYEQTPVDGICDACKVDGHDRRLFIKEENVPHCWLTKDEQRRRAKNSTWIGR